jgi:hypothetical protein
MKGKHPFKNARGFINVIKIASGEFDKLDSPNYSNALKELIYLMMHRVGLISLFYLFIFNIYLNK